MEDTKPVMGSDGNRLFEDYLSSLNDRLIKVESELKRIKHE